MKKITLSIVTIALLQTLAFANEDLGEVIVTSASKEPLKINEVTQDVTVITKEEIEGKGYQNVPEILSHIPGFIVSSNGGMGQTASVFLRGLNSANILFLLNGTPLTDYSQPSPSAAIEHIPIDSIEKIEVIKGGQNGIWGSGATIGTINIITKDQSKSNQTLLTLNGGSHSTKGVGLDISKNFQKVSLSFGTHWLDSNSISALQPKNAEKDGYKNLSYYANTQFKINNNNAISLFYQYYNGKFDFDTKKANDNISHGKNKQRLYGFNYHYHNNNLTVDTKISQVKIDRTYQYPGYSFDAHGKSTFFSLISNYTFNSDNIITLGLEHTLHKINTLYISSFGKTPYKDNFHNNAIFTSYVHKQNSLLGADTTFNAVIRYDEFDKFKNKFTYRFGIKRECNIIKGLHSSANIYTGYTAPSLYQFTNAKSPLTPQKSKGFDISFGYKNLLNITYFHTKIDNEILYDYTTFKYYNAQKTTKSTGIEISSEYAFGNSGLIIGANWTHIFKSKDGTGKNSVRIPKNSVSIYVDYYLNENSHIGLMATYVGKRRDQYFAPGSWIPSDTTLKSYTTVDLSYNTNIGDKLKLNIALKNVFNKKYESVKGYSVEGRSIYAKLEYKF